MEEKLNSGEFLPLMVQIARLMKPEIYVELGVRKGNTFRAIAPLARTAIAVDKERGRIPEMLKHSSLKHARFYQMKTDTFASIWADNPKRIDLLFIDADHHKEQVLKDFDNFSRFIRADTGLILLHDTLPAGPDLLAADRCCSAWEAAWEIRRNPRYCGFEIVTIPGKWVGLSIVRKVTKPLYWQNGTDEKSV
jgi:predicted O-methyltransferase YrrM